MSLLTGHGRRMIRRLLLSDMGHGEPCCCRQCLGVVEGQDNRERAGYCMRDMDVADCDVLVRGVAAYPYLPTPTMRLVESDCSRMPTVTAVLELQPFLGRSELKACIES